MAASKIQLHLSQLIHMIETKFQRLYPYFRGQATRNPMSGHVGNQSWWPLTGSIDMTYRISQLVYLIAMQFQRLHPCFRDQATQRDYWEYCLGMLEIKDGGH